MAFFSILILWLFALILDVTSAPKSKHPAHIPALPAIFRPEPLAARHSRFTLAPRRPANAATGIAKAGSI